MNARKDLLDDLDRKARDAYALAGSYGNGPRASYWLGFCQKVVKACADGRRLERDLEAERRAHRYTTEHPGWAALREADEERGK